MFFTNFITSVAHFHFYPEAFWELAAVIGPLCGWPGSSEMEWLCSGKIFQSQLNISKHWAVWPLCFPCLMHERRYLPAISCAENRNKSSLEPEGKWENQLDQAYHLKRRMLAVRHLPKTSPKYLKLCVVNRLNGSTEDKELFISLRFNFSEEPQIEGCPIWGH